MLFVYDNIKHFPFIFTNNLSIKTGWPNISNGKGSWGRVELPVSQGGGPYSGTQGQQRPRRKVKT